MQWLSASYAWFGISLLVIVAMYILKKSYQPRMISNHILWRRALQEQEANKPWQKLKKRLLLWLQLLVALCIVIALMEPVIEKLIAKDEHVIVVLDRSASMVAMNSSSGDSYFQLAKDRMIDWLKTEVAGSPITLIVNGEYPEIITSREEQADKVINAIKDLQPYYGVSDDETTLSLARALVTEDEQQVISLYVDQSFKGTSIQTETTHSNTSREYWNIIGNEEVHRNVNIRSFTINSDIANEAEGFITIAHPQGMQQPLTLIVTAYDSNNKVVSTVEKSQIAGSGQYTTVELNKLPVSYYYKAEVKATDGDHNISDNMMYQVLAEDSEYNVLLISEGNLFLEKALQLMNADLTKLAPSSEPPTDSKNNPYHLIIVDGDYDRLQLDPAWSSYIAKYPLWIIDHPKKGNTSSAAPTSQEVTVTDHEVTQYITFQDTYISQMRKLTNTELNFGTVILKYGGLPAIIAGYEMQKPRLRFTFSLQDTDLPLRAEFPILMMQSLQYMAKGTSDQLGTYLVGSEPAITLSTNTASSYWQAMSDTGSTEKSNTTSYDQPLLTPDVPGVYQLVELDSNNERVQTRVAVVHAELSEYSYSMNSQLSELSQEQLQLSDAGEGQGLQSIIPWLAMLIMCCLVLEWEVYRRGL
ncbi:vWA domain-containing protein [Paenibacillus endoradicis]|uniref:vWA domain-containing protein n=1 Tax=Paenibacillus endoradicis TaxID=2972487 RepID=UPI002159B1DE|nr:VWA domain-containing protein [Paenibacillus endoradicis]MCR8656355.1 VWA domain-containing protein [Paenibacillus endoradicis]